MALVERAEPAEMVSEMIEAVDQMVQERSPMALREEIAAYDARLSELKATYPGKFVVFKGSSLIGAWDTMEAAAQNAVLRFGRGPYLIRQVGAPRASIPASVLYRHIEFV